MPQIGSRSKTLSLVSVHLTKFAQLIQMSFVESSSSWLHLYIIYLMISQDLLDITPDTLCSWYIYQHFFMCSFIVIKKNYFINTVRPWRVEGSDPHESAPGFEVCQMKGTYIGSSELKLFKSYEIGLLRIRPLCF